MAADLPSVGPIRLQYHVLRTAVQGCMNPLNRPSDARSQQHSDEKVDSSVYLTTFRPRAIDFQIDYD